MTVQGRGWSDLTAVQRRAVVALAVVEVCLTAAALTDLARRPPGQVRGPKQLWALAAFIQPIGPAAYLLAGRRGTSGGAEQPASRRARP